MSDPMSNHQCEKLIDFSTDTRTIWLGKLTEPIPESPTETHCIHIVTPYKTVVLGVNVSDAGWLAVFAQMIQGKPINQHWIDLQLKKSEVIR